MILAIVIPYYKKTFFRQTLQSLADQTDKRFKVYIGNDASPENPDDLILEFQDKLDLVYHKFEENFGGKSLVKQWERCINLTQGEEWITILGDDDVYNCNVVKEYYKHISIVQVENINVIRFASKKIDEKGESISRIYENLIRENSVDFLFKGVRSSLSEYYFKSVALFNIGFKDLPLAWSSDRLVILEVSNFGVIYTINKAVISVRISDKSISGSKHYDSQKLEALFKFNYYLIDRYKNKFNDYQYESLKNQLNKCYLNSKRKLLRYFMINYVYLKKVDMRGICLFHFEIYNSLKLKLTKL